jgi:hypothetical protein
MWILSILAFTVDMALLTEGGIVSLGVYKRIMKGAPLW